MTDAKTCSRCKRLLPVEKFSRCSSNKSGRSYWCKECTSKNRRELSCREVAAEKKCKRCQKVLPASEFWKNALTKNGLATMCKACHKSTYKIGTEEWRAENRLRYRTERGWARKTLHEAKRRAKKYGLPFSITESDLFLPDVCPVLGIPLEFGSGERVDGSPSIDRIIPAKGYVPGNVAVISWLANRLKWDKTDPELFEKVAAYLRRPLDT